VEPPNAGLHLLIQAIYAPVTLMLVQLRCLLLAKERA
jgi:hypothetical protein